MSIFQSLESRVWRDGPLPNGLSVAMVVYLCAIGAGLLPLLAYGLLAWFGFGPKAGLPRHFIGYMGANVFHDALSQMWRLWVGVFIAGVVGVSGTARGLGEPTTILLAISCAAAAILAIAWFLPRLGWMDRHGQLTKHLLGTCGLVIEDVPAGGKSEGIVSAHYPTRGTRYLAICRDTSLLPGQQARIIAVLDEHHLEVAPIPDSAKQWLANRQKAQE